MGCCLSTGDHHPETHSIGGAPSTSPPPVLELEETVKEVLLETPAVVPKFYVNANALVRPENQELNAGVGMLTPAIDAGPDPRGGADHDEMVSEISKICSDSESLSCAAAAEGKQLDDEYGVVNKTPSAMARGGPAGGGRRGIGGLRDKEISRREAAAPPFQEKMGPPALSGGKVVGEDRRRRGDRESAAAGNGQPRNGIEVEEEIESLENPIVSLECFIFL